MTYLGDFLTDNRPSLRLYSFILCVSFMNVHVFKLLPDVSLRTVTLEGISKVVKSSLFFLSSLH